MEDQPKNPKFYPSEETHQKNPLLSMWLQNKRVTEKNLGEMIEEFHRKFDIPLGTTSFEDYERVMMFRTEFMLDEEITELDKAVCEGDVVEVLDALADIIYVAAGTAVEIFGGRTLDVALKRVHESNMTKQKGALGHKVEKGPEFKPVILDDLIW